MPRALILVGCLAAAAGCTAPAAAPASGAVSSPSDDGRVLKIEQGFVDVGDALIYYEALGRGEPLLIVHGGPGASHDYFLPYLLPLARTNRIVFIDERGSGKSTRLEDPKGYTVENMVEDLEAVRDHLGLGKISMLGHSFGGVLAEAYALKYQAHLSHLILGSTFHSTRALNEVFVQMKAHMTPELRNRINAMEKAGLFGHGKPYERGRYTNDYMTAAWGEGYFPYIYQKHPDAGYDPVSAAGTSWELYREMWGSHGEFVVDGNLASVEYADKLGSITVPTLVTVGDHDEVAPSIAADIHAKIPGSQLVVFPQSGHMTFVDQPALFVKTVADFVKSR